MAANQYPLKDSTPPAAGPLKRGSALIYVFKLFVRKGQLELHAAVGAGWASIARNEALLGPAARIRRLAGTPSLPNSSAMALARSTASRLLFSVSPRGSV